MPERKLVGVTADNSEKKLVGVSAEGNEPQPKSDAWYKQLFSPDVTETPENQLIPPIEVPRKILRGTRPFIDGLGVAGGLTLSAGNPAGGVLGGVGTDLAVQHALKGLGEPPAQGAQGLRNLIGAPEPPQYIKSLEDAGSINAENEFGGMLQAGIFNKVRNAVRGYQLQPVQTINPIFNRLDQYNVEQIKEGGGASYSQLNGGGLLNKGAEDIFGGKFKREQLANAAEAGTQSGVKLINRVSGKKISAFEDPFEVAKRFGGDVAATRDAYLRASGEAAEVSKNIANLNPVRVMTTSGVKNVNGPVVLTGASQIAQDFLDKQNTLYDVHSTADLMKIVEDQKKPLVVAAMQVAKYKDGTPIPFEAAWELKKAAAEHGGFDEIAKSYKQGQFASLSAAVDADIEHSIGNWNPNNRNVALQAYQDAKTLVSNRHELFQSGDAISQILTSTNTPKKAFDDVLSDPLLTGKAIAAAGPGGRSNLQAYQIQRILQDSFDPATKTYDRAKLIRAWQDPDKQAVFSKLYNSAQRQDIGNFIESLSNVSQKQSALGQFSTAIRVGNSAVNIAGSLVAGTLASHHLTTPGVIVGGAVAMSEFTKRILLDPKIARAATIMMNSAPASNEARFLGKQVFAALNGVRMVLQTDSGKTIPATIEDGQIVPDAQR